MNYMTLFGLLSILLNILLILTILIRSPNEQSLQENLTPFNLFESSKQAETSIDKLIQILTILYFLVAICYIIEGYL